MTNSSNKPPVWFWIVSLLALIWNGLGVMAYLTRAYATDEMIASLPEAQQAEFLVEYPTWYTAAFAMAVFAGALGCIALLLRKKIAYSLFILSGLSAIIQHIYLFINFDLPNVVMPLMVIAVCVFLIWFSKKATAKYWIS